VLRQFIENRFIKIGVTMEITIRDKKQQPAYAIRTAPGRLCFELFTWMPERAAKGRYSGKSLPAGFVSQGRYPTTLPHALRMVAECISREKPAHFDVVAAQEGLRILSAQVDYMLDSFGAEVIDSVKPDEQG
jgi:hypothetical protein